MIATVMTWWRQARCFHNIHYTRIARDGVIESRYRCDICGKVMHGPHPPHVPDDYEWFSKSKELGPDVIVVLRENKTHESQTLPQTPYEIHKKSKAWDKYL